MVLAPEGIRVSAPTVTLQRITGDEKALAYVEELLEANGLPWQDVRSNPDCFAVGYVGGVRIGGGGVEGYGTDGLLRSVVVERSRRGEGLGTALCDALEADASSERMETLYLLTTTADDFFADRKYGTIDRADAPAAIRRTTEFEELCPATATCMRKSLSVTHD